MLRSHLSVSVSLGRKIDNVKRALGLKTDDRTIEEALDVTTLVIDTLKSGKTIVSIDSNTGVSREMVFNLPSIPDNKRTL